MKKQEKIITVMKKNVKPMSTPEIDRMIIGNITVDTMKKLEKQGLVKRESRHFSKPFDKETGKPIPYAELDDYDKERIFWVPSKVYIWKLTKKGLETAS